MFAAFRKEEERRTSYAHRTPAEAQVERHQPDAPFGGWPAPLPPRIQGPWGPGWRFPVKRIRLTRVSGCQRGCVRAAVRVRLPLQVRESGVAGTVPATRRQSTAPKRATLEAGFGK